MSKEKTMEQDHIIAGTRRSSGGIQTIAIVCTALMIGIAPYTILFGLRVPIYSFTPIFYYFNTLVILPFLAVIGFVCSLRLIQENVWRGFGFGSAMLSLAISAFTLRQWVTIDLVFKHTISVPHAWKAITGGIAFALVISIVATRGLRGKTLGAPAHLLLLFSSLCLAVGAFHSFQFMPRFIERGWVTGSLQHLTDEDMVDTPAPSFVLSTLHKDTYNIESDRGKVILLTFWATWCGPCLAEMPSIESLHREFDNAQTAFLAVSVDQDTSRVKPFIDSVGYSFTTLYVSKQVLELYRIEFIPKAFIIDKKGIIRKVYNGNNSNFAKAMRSNIRDLLNE